MLKTIQIITLIQGLFVITVLFVNRKDYKKTTFWLLFGSLISVLLYLSGDDENNLFIKNLDLFLFDNSLFATFLFLFFRYSKNKKEEFSKLDYLFFLPNIIYFIIEIIELKLQTVSKILDTFELFTELSFVSYLVIIFYSIIIGKKKHWITYFIIPIVILFVVSFINDIFKIIGLSSLRFFNNQNFNTYFSLIVALLFYFIAFKLLSKDNLILPKIEKNKYKNSTLNLNLIEEYKLNLIQSMEHDKLYLNGKLSIIDVSEKLNIPRHYISEVLNEYMNTNFQDFINKYRVEEFINRLKNDQNNQFSLLAIANDVGFNSKSSFNAIFKKFKGLTPTEFKKNLIR